MKYLLLYIAFIISIFYIKRKDNFLDGNTIHIRAIGRYDVKSIRKLKRILNEYYLSPVIVDVPVSAYYSYDRIDGVECIKKYDSNENTIFITKDRLYSSYDGKRLGGLSEYMGNTLIVVDDNYLNLRRVVIHEIGHTQGLDHCDDNHCYMSTNRDDNEVFYLCKKCKNVYKIMSFFNI